MIHVAVLWPQFIEMILAGRKTVELRLTRQARAPYEAIEPGDRIYFKQSAGPYRGVGLVDHVLFEADLTPHRIKRLRRDYNDLIGGDEEYWHRKRFSRYASLIWLRDVQPCGLGPDIRPLQGAAWMTLDHEPAWRRVDFSVDDGRSFAIPLTEGNLRNNTVYVTNVIDRFPPQSFGGPTRDEAGREMTLHLHGGPTVRSDIVAKRRLMRTRAWGKWFADHGAQPGDGVIFTEVAPMTYHVGLVRLKDGCADRSAAYR